LKKKKCHSQPDVSLSWGRGEERDSRKNKKQIATVLKVYITKKGVQKYGGRVGWCKHERLWGGEGSEKGKGGFEETAPYGQRPLNGVFPTPRKLKRGGVKEKKNKKKKKIRPGAPRWKDNWGTTNKLGLLGRGGGERKGTQEGGKTNKSGVKKAIKKKKEKKKKKNKRQ